MSNKIGIGVITCNRQEFFQECISSLPGVDTVVVINDGQPYPSEIYPPKVKEVIQHTKNKSVGVSKNEALRFLIQDQCDHLFICEDDIKITRPDICEQYIKTASISGIWHLNYGGHGSYNRDPNTGQPIIKNSVEYTPDCSVDFYHNILGAWSYYYKGIIKNIGYIDERFINAHDHTEHTYRILKAGLHSPWWWFADIHNSWGYIADIKANFEGSEIRKNKEEWMKNYQQALYIFKLKHGVLPTEIPDTPPDQVISILQEIQQKYARP
jgi:glycosyltransferase involved in cell wall biosynthesis